MKALRIAEYIINQCANSGKPINNLRLNIVLYLIHKDYLQKKKKPLFEDDVCVGKAFPIIFDVYSKYCCYGALPIRKVTTDCVAYGGLLAEGIDLYAQMSSYELITLANKEGGARQMYKGYCGDNIFEVIPNEIIMLRG